MFNHEMQIVQFSPARAKKKVLYEELSTMPLSTLWEQKIDGERYLQHLNARTSYKHAITSRRLSAVTGRYVEKTDRVPHITNNPHFKPGRSILDSELVSSGDMVLIDFPGKLWDKLADYDHPHMKWLRAQFQGALPTYPHVSHTVSIMGSNAELAIQKQQERGLIWAYVFDMIQYDSQNLTNNTQEARRRFLANFLLTVPPGEGIQLMPMWQGLTTAETELLFNLITDVDGEGIIGKDPSAKYNAPKNWWKCKKAFPADVVYTGNSKLGEANKTGLMEGMAASLEVGCYDISQTAIHPIGWISAIRDGHHRLETPEQHMTHRNEVVEIWHNGLQIDSQAPFGYTLRHPRWRRDRLDKNPTDCTFKNLYDEAN